MPEILTTHSFAGLSAGFFLPMNLSTTSNAMTLGGAGGYVAVEKVKETSISTDLVHEVFIQLSPAVHISFGTALQITAVSIGVAGLLLPQIKKLINKWKNNDT